ESQVMKSPREERNVKKSNIGRGTIAGGVIITWDGGMSSYACIYGSSCKGGKNSMSKRYLEVMA
ncbi:hypothetical protein Tco_1286850, partial [Tanacetum coccineum]